MIESKCVYRYSNIAYKNGVAVRITNVTSNKGVQLRCEVTTDLVNNWNPFWVNPAELIEYKLLNLFKVTRWFKPMCVTFLVTLLKFGIIK